MVPLPFPTKTVRTGVGTVGKSAVRSPGKRRLRGLPASSDSGVAVDRFTLLGLSSGIRPTEVSKGWKDKRVNSWPSASHSRRFRNTFPSNVFGSLDDQTRKL